MKDYEVYTKGYETVAEFDTIEEAKAWADEMGKAEKFDTLYVACSDGCVVYGYADKFGYHHCPDW